MAVVGTWLVALAVAQSGGEAGSPRFDAHGFPLAPQDGDAMDPLVVQRPGGFRAGEGFATVVAEYGRRPLRGAGGALPGDVLAAHVLVGAAPLQRLRIEAGLPVFVPLGSAAGPVLGDAHVGAAFVLGGADGSGRASPGAWGVSARLFAPTGAPEHALGRATWAGSGRLTATAGGSRASVSAEAGVDVGHSPSGQVTPDLRAVAGAGLGIAPASTVGLSLEGVASVPVVGGPVAAEALLGLRLRPRRTGPAFVLLGTSVGLTDAVGVPEVRAFAGVGLVRRVGSREPDRDPVHALQVRDLCPADPETVNGWKDDDGCPDRLGTLVVDVRFAGASMPADAVVSGPEGDRRQRIGPRGLALDAVPGTTWRVEATHGCLRGEAEAVAQEGGARLVVNLSPVLEAEVHVSVNGPDGAPLPEAGIRWASEPPECAAPDVERMGEGGLVIQPLTRGLHRVTVTAPGHTVHEEEIRVEAGDEVDLAVQLDRSLVEVASDRLRLLEKIEFSTGGAVIESVSHPLLDELAAVLMRRPELGRIEIGGHTDARGEPTYNLDLSQKRAQAVRAYLVQKGVAAERLHAVGYGEAMPIDTNRTAAGRDNNRRVELVFVPSGAP